MNRRFQSAAVVITALAATFVAGPQNNSWRKQGSARSPALSYCPVDDDDGLKVAAGVRVANDDPDSCFYYGDLTGDAWNYDDGPGSNTNASFGASPVSRKLRPEP